MSEDVDFDGLRTLTNLAELQLRVKSFRHIVTSAVVNRDLLRRTTEEQVRLEFFFILGRVRRSAGDEFLVLRLG